MHKRDTSPLLASSSRAQKVPVTVTHLVPIANATPVRAARPERLNSLHRAPHHYLDPKQQRRRGPQQLILRRRSALGVLLAKLLVSGGYRETYLVEFQNNVSFIEGRASSSALSPVLIKVMAAGSALRNTVATATLVSAFAFALAFWEAAAFACAFALRCVGVPGVRGGLQR